MDTNIAYGLMIATLGVFGYIGYQASNAKELEADEYLSARGSQDWLRIGLSLFASGMGIWILFGPSEVGYYGGFWDVVGYAVSSATPFILLAYVGPKIRDRLPNGVTLADYVRIRLGRPMQIYVGLISVLYMFTFLFAEFTAIGKATETLSDAEPLVPMFCSDSRHAVRKFRPMSCPLAVQEGCRVPKTEHPSYLRAYDPRWTSLHPSNPPKQSWMVGLGQRLETVPKGKYPALGTLRQVVGH